MNGYQVPDFIKKGEYYLPSDEEMKAYRQKSMDRDKAVKLLTILMAINDKPLTAGEILARVRAFCQKDPVGKSFYFYWGQQSFQEFLDTLANHLFSFLSRIEDGGTIKYQTNKFGLWVFNNHKQWLEEFLGETTDQIKKSWETPCK